MLAFTLSALLSLSAGAQPPEKDALDLNALCGDAPVNRPWVVIDDGFCQAWTESQMESTTRSSLLAPEKLNSTAQTCAPSPSPAAPSGEKWKIRFYASHSFTSYFNSDLRIDSSRYQLSIKDYEWAERGSRDFFNPETWKKEGNNPFQMIDEPTNTFTISIEKNGTEFYLSAFHPKYLQAPDQSKFMSGTIDGVAVNGVQQVNTPFHGYVQVPGESKLVRNQCTHKQMEYTVGAGKRLTLASGKAGSLVYTPSVGVGVMTGACLTVAVKEGAWWDFDENTDPLRIQGFGGTVSNRIEFNSPNERFGLFYENKLGLYKMQHGFLDGTQKYNLGYMGNSVGMKFMIYNPNRKRTPASN
jgi:hypothetical protein